MSKHKPKFTPGPWTVDSGCFDKEIEISCSGDDSWKYLRAWVNSDDCDPKTAMANANLIAAAPDMYAALIEVRNSLKVGTADGMTLSLDDVADLAAAAIAKAEGRS